MGLRRPPQSEGPPPAIPCWRPFPGSPARVLSKRETEVLELIRVGLTNRQIGQRLFVSTNTVNKHVAQVLRKLEVSNRVQAAIYPGLPTDERPTLELRESA